MPLVTVGIPFHNEETYLEQAVRSILVQTFEDLEVLLVDDGSTDRSLEIARSLGDPRVTVRTDGTRRFLAARLNEITRHAKGELVARMDADDVSHPERLAHQIAILREDPACDAVGTWAALVDDHEQLFAVVESTALPPSPAAALSHGIFPHATLVGRRSWLIANPYDETLTRTEDRDLWCRTVCTSRFAVVPKALYVVRSHSRTAHFLPKYVASQEQARELIARYGPSAVGLPRTALLWGASYAKTTIMQIAVRMNLATHLVHRRGRAPTALEDSLVREAIARSCL